MMIATVKKIDEEIKKIKKWARQIVADKKTSASQLKAIIDTNSEIDDIFPNNEFVNVWRILIYRRGKGKYLFGPYRKIKIVFQYVVTKEDVYFNLILNICVDLFSENGKYKFKIEKNQEKIEEIKNSMNSDLTLVAVKKNYIYRPGGTIIF